MDRFFREVNEDGDAPERATERRARLGGVADDAGGCAWREVGLGDDDSVVQPESVRDLYWEKWFIFWSNGDRILSGRGGWRCLHMRGAHFRSNPLGRGRFQSVCEQSKSTIYTKSSPQTHYFRSMKGSMSYNCKFGMFKYISNPSAKVVAL